MLLDVTCSGSLTCPPEVGNLTLAQAALLVVRRSYSDTADSFHPIR